MSVYVRKRQDNMKLINKRTKINLIFDEKARKEYLTGFRKRKAERRKKFSQKLQKELKLERKRLQTELRAKIKKSPSNKSIPGLEHLVECNPEVFELPSHTVTVETISGIGQESDTQFLGRNEKSESSGEEDHSKLEAGFHFADKKGRKDINKEMNRKLKKTKAFKKQTQIVRDRSRKKAFHIRKKNKH